jgi:hypothetical protein
MTTPPQPDQPQPLPPAPVVGQTLGPPAPRPEPDPADQPPAAPQQPVPARPATGRASVPVPGTVSGSATVAESAPAAQAVPAPPAAQAAPIAAAVPPAPLGPFPVVEPVEASAPPPARPSWQARRHRGLDRLSIGRHVAPTAELDQLQLTSVSFGLWLGRDQAGGPVTVRMFRPAPLHVVLVGGAWAAKLVTYRALRFGARLVVVTPDPAGWIDLGRRATGRTDRVAVVDDLRAPVSRVASADAPVLRLTGLGAAAEQDPPVTALPQWNTRLSVLPQATPEQVTPYRAAQLASADLLLTQRLSAPEAATLAAALRLTERTSYVLQVLHDDMLAVLTRAGVRYAWLHPTSTEQSTLGWQTRY